MLISHVRHLGEQGAADFRIVPIPGATKLHRLEENIGAVLIELTPDDLREIDVAASKITVQGFGTQKSWNK